MCLSDGEMDWIRDHLRIVGEGQVLLNEFVGVVKVRAPERYMQLSDQDIDLMIDDLIDERNSREAMASF